MKIYKEYYFMLFVILLLLLSCNQLNRVQQDSITTYKNNIYATETTIRIIPSKTETMDVISNSLDDECNEEIYDLGENKYITGTIVLYKDNGGNRYNLLLYDTETHGTTEITKQYIDNTTNPLFLNGLAVSPNGEYLAYQTSYFDDDRYIGNMINIVGSRNEKISEINNPSTTVNFNWVNNDNLAIISFLDKRPLIINEVFSGDQKFLYPILGEGILDVENIRSWLFYGVNKNVYNSDLSRVVYPAYENGLPIVNIRDVQNNMDIVTIQSNIGWGTSPVWSQDGNTFAIAVADDRNYSEDYIYIINREGDIVFQTDKSSTKLLEKIYSMSWSPNSKFLAFIYTIEESLLVKYQLGILDVEDMKITTFCSPEAYLSIPYWSPDNKYVLYVSKNSNSEEVKSLVINIETGQSYLVMDEYYAGGWMK